MFQDENFMILKLVTRAIFRLTFVEQVCFLSKQPLRKVYIYGGSLFANLPSALDLAWEDSVTTLYLGAHLHSLARLNCLLDSLPSLEHLSLFVSSGSNMADVLQAVGRHTNLLRFDLRGIGTYFASIFDRFVALERSKICFVLCLSKNYGIFSEHS